MWVLLGVKTHNAFSVKAIYLNDRIYRYCSTVFKYVLLGFIYQRKQF